MAGRKTTTAKEPTMDGISLASDDTPQEPVAENAASSEGPKTATPQPNLIWSNERVYKQTEKDGPFTVVNWLDKPTEEDKEGKPKFGEPVDFIQVGLRQIKLPDAATQKKGFYHPEAKLLRRVVGGLKEFKPKG
jgi:hypothetical protein